MRRALGRWFAVLGACAASLAIGPDTRAESPAPPTTATATLTINVNGFEGTKGQALIALYATKDTWLKVDKTYRIQKTKITGSSLVAVFPDLPVGVYAASVIHDANGNGKMDMHWFPIPGPSEGAGVSNDAKATFGPPSFNDARFRLAEPGGVISIAVRY